MHINREVEIKPRPRPRTISLQQAHQSLERCPSTSCGAISGHAMDVVDGRENLHNDTPSEHQRGEPNRRPGQLQNNVGRYFQKRIRNKEQREGGVILVARELQILGHSGNLGISNWSGLVEIKSILRRTLTVSSVKERKHCLCQLNYIIDGEWSLQ